MTDIESQVCAVILARQQKGIAKYGMTVAQNPAELREWLQHAYEEALDLAIYLKRAIQKLNDAKDAWINAAHLPVTYEPVIVYGILDGEETAACHEGFWDGRRWMSARSKGEDERGDMLHQRIDRVTHYRPMPENP